jgi:site-specific DNA recombinase
MSKKLNKKIIDADAAYIRVSHVDVPERDPEARQETINDLVAVRTLEVREAATRDGRTIPDNLLYIDMDLSGTSIEKRPNMQRLIADAKKGRFARIWTRNLSRLFRNLGEQIAAIDAVEKAGCRWISLQEPNDGEKHVLDLIRNQIGAVNQYMAAQTGQAIRANNRIVASMGRFVGGRPPLGYMYNKETKEVLPDPVRKKDAIMVFEVFCQEKTFAGTAGILNAMGIKTRDGALWRHKKIKDTLINPTYRGMVKFGDEEWPGLHEKFIPEKLLLQVDEILTTRCRTNGNLQGNKADPQTYTYSKLLVCGLCGDLIRHQPGKWHGQRHNYWICSNRKDHKLCNLPTYKTPELDLFVVESIKVALTHELGNLKDYFEKNPLSAKKKSPVIRNFEIEAAAIKEKLAKAAVEYTEGFMDQEQYRSVVTGYRHALELIEQKLPADDKKQPKITTEEILNFRKVFTSGWKSTKEAQRQQLISQVVEKIFVYPDKLIIRTLLSLGDITIPTLMFEKKECPKPAKTSPRHSLSRGTPDRTRTCASGSGGPHSIR